MCLSIQKLASKCYGVLLEIMITYAANSQIMKQINYHSGDS